MERKVKKFIALLFACVLTPSLALADGCPPGEPCYQPPPKAVKKAPAVKPAPAVAAPVPAAPPPAAKSAPKPAPVEENGLGFTIAPSLGVLFFDCEDSQLAPGIYADARPGDLPLNVRVGVEGTRVDSDQFNFRQGSPYQNGDPEFNLIRIPLSLEYVVPVMETTNVFLGGGPDLLILSDAGDDTTVGGHLGARVEQGITESIGVSVGGGYLWGEGDAKSGETIDLDSAFVGAGLTIKLN